MKISFLNIIIKNRFIFFCIYFTFKDFFKKSVKNSFKDFFFLFKEISTKLNCLRTFL